MRTHAPSKQKPLRQYKNLLPNTIMVATDTNRAVAITMARLEGFEEHYVWALTHLREEPGVRQRYLEHLACEVEAARAALNEAVDLDCLARCDA